MGLLRIAGGGSIRANHLFGFFRARRRSPAPPVRGVFLVNVKVGRGSNVTMSSGLAGAYVSAYVTAAGPEAAARLAVTKLTARGFEFQAIQGPITRIELGEWSRHVVQSWPEFISEFPGRDELAAGLGSDSVFFGPFVGYER